MKTSVLNGILPRLRYIVKLLVAEISLPGVAACYHRTPTFQLIALIYIFPV